ncbi:hypothetical protein [Desnuesiella massiliensis]|uniref:hypothetical protein n=1 Tax=Desnuesiella massiliensis TaxID=1650662 RepID=UPI0006E2BC9E|nr:hypothetical protein [Desnuesiella massiliensis]
MNNMTISKRLKTLIIGATILAIGGTTIYAASANAATEDAANKKPLIEWKKNKEGKMPGEKGFKIKEERGSYVKGAEQMKTYLTSLVNEGVLTQQKADSITNYLQKKEEERKAEFDKIKAMTPEERKNYMSQKKGERLNPFDAMVKDGVLTQTEADTIKSKLQEKRATERKQKITEQLSGLVENKTITQDQVNKLIEKLQKKDEEAKALHEKLKAMTPEERKSYMEQNKKDRKDILQELVDEGTITKDQADAMRKVMPMHHGAKGHGFHKEKKSN